MFLRRIRSEGLAHISYYLESDGMVAVIDPRRDVDEYLSLAQDRDDRIVTVLETHRHEDFVSGALELANATGAAIYHGEQLEFGYGNPLSDGQELRLGDLIVTAVHTPGHTYESNCYLVSDHKGPFLLFSGDTLFCGDVGRTDLAGPGKLRDLSEKLYDSLHQRVIPLGPQIMVLPAHGAGSVCGRSIEEREFTTIGLEAMWNHSLGLSRLDFVMAKMAEGMERPIYFDRMEALNLHGPILLGTLPRTPPISPRAVKDAQEGGALVLDLRQAHNYATAHVPRSLNAWLDGLPAYGGHAVPYGRPLILVADGHYEVEMAVRYLVRLGYEDILGHMTGGMESWTKSGLPLSSIKVLSVHEIRARQQAGDEMLLVDLRDRREMDDGTVPGSKAIHLGKILERSSELPADRDIVLFCSSGNRGGIAASMLRNSGIDNVTIMLGGFLAWKKGGLPVEPFKNE